MRLHTGVYRQCKRVCTESWLWEKNPLPHQVIKPASMTCRSDALPTELHPMIIITFCWFTNSACSTVHKSINYPNTETAVVLNFLNVDMMHHHEYICLLPPPPHQHTHSPQPTGLQVWWLTVNSITNDKNSDTFARSQHWAFSKEVCCSTAARTVGREDVEHWMDTFTLALPSPAVCDLALKRKKDKKDWINKQNSKKNDLINE